MIVLIVLIVVLETGQFHLVLAFYVLKNQVRKLNYPKRFSDNIEKKIKYDLFFIKTIDLGP